MPTYLAHHPFLAQLQALWEKGPSSAQILRFERALAENLLETKASTSSIGTLGEKRMHAILKLFYESDVSKQEIKLPDKRYVADVLVEGTIFEIQTGSFRPLVPKLEYYLKNTDYQVCVVHPIYSSTILHWISPVDGSVSVGRKTSHRQNIFTCLDEIYYLVPFLDNPRFSITLLSLDIEEYKFQNGKSRDGKHWGVTRYERIPKCLNAITTWKSDDYARLLPFDMPSPFTAKDYTKATGIGGMAAYGTLRVLTQVGVVTQSDKHGRAMLFSLIEQ